MAEVVAWQVEYPNGHIELIPANEYEGMPDGADVAMALTVAADEREESLAATDYAESMAATLKLVTEALGMPAEPHQGWQERIIDHAQTVAKERDALAAQVERFRTAAMRPLFETVNDEKSAREMRQIAADTPSTSLAAHDAALLRAEADRLKELAYADGRDTPHIRAGYAIVLNIRDRAAAIERREDVS